MTMKRILIVAIWLFLLTGCAGNTMFIYKPSTPAEGVRKLPLKVAVLPFKDATEDFTKRGNVLLDQEHLMLNLAKTGMGNAITPITPELWAKAFADDLASSGDFQKASFIYSPSELKDEEFIIEGAVEKAYFSDAGGTPNEFTLSLRALERTDNRLIWEKEISRAWKTTPNTLYYGCGMGAQCYVDRLHTEINKVLQSIFAEAREDFVKTLEPLSKKQTGDYGRSPAALPASLPAAESVDETIEGILKGK